MTERVHGYIVDNRLGTLMGDNAFVSIAILPAATTAAGAAVEVDSTGVLTPLAQFKALYAINPAKGIAEQVDVPGGVETIDVADGKIINSAVVKVANVPAALRTFGKKPDGSDNVIESDEAYLKAWAAQENLRRLVDTVQQRAVLMAISPAGKVTSPARTGVVSKDRKYGEWSTTVPAGDVHSVTFMVERGTSFDKARPNTYGQPGVSEIGEELVQELLNLPLMYVTGTGLSAEAKPYKLTVADYSVRIDRSVPQIL